MKHPLKEVLHIQLTDARYNGTHSAMRSELFKVANLSLSRDIFNRLYGLSFRVKQLNVKVMWHIYFPQFYGYVGWGVTAP